MKTLILRFLLSPKTLVGLLVLLIGVGLYGGYKYISHERLSTQYTRLENDHATLLIEYARLSTQLQQLKDDHREQAEALSEHLVYSQEWVDKLLLNEALQREALVTYYEERLSDTGIKPLTSDPLRHYTEPARIGAAGLWGVYCAMYVDVDCERNALTRATEIKEP